MNFSYWVENFGLGCGSNVREPAQQVLGSEFNPQFCKKKKKIWKAHEEWKNFPYQRVAFREWLEETNTPLPDNIKRIFFLLLCGYFSSVKVLQLH
jgi:hypothetical protein